MIVHNRRVGALLLMAAFLVWLVALAFLQQIKPFGLSMTHAVGAAALFAVACFLPERPRAAFYSRKSALGGVGVFSWLSIGHLPIFGGWTRGLDESPLLLPALFIGIPMLLAVGIYWISLFAIRGFRANAEYEVEGETVGDDEPPVQAATYLATPSDTAVRKS